MGKKYLEREEQIYSERKKKERKRKRERKRERVLRDKNTLLHKRCKVFLIKECCVQAHTNMKPYLAFLLGWFA